MDENDPFIDGLPIKNCEFPWPMAMLNNQMVLFSYIVSMICPMIINSISMICPSYSVDFLLKAYGLVVYYNIYI